MRLRGAGIGTMLCAFVSIASGASGATVPRELKDVAPKIERELKKGRAPVETAKKKLARANEQLAALDADRAKANEAPPAAEGAPAALPDVAVLKSIDAKIEKLKKTVPALEAKLADAEKAALPFDQVAKALGAYTRGNWKVARDEAESSKLPGVDKELAYMGALARMRLGELKEAVERLDKPELAGVGDTQRFLGLAKLRLGDKAGALGHLQKARIPADDGEAHAALGEILLEDKKMEPAADELERAVKATPGDTRVLGMLGRVQLELGRNEKAAKTLERLVQLAPRDHEAAYLEAVARSRAGDSTGAERALTRFLSKSKRAAGDARYERPHLAPYLVPTYGYDAGLPGAPDEGSARNQVAVYLAERGEYEQSRRELDGAPANDARAAYNRGLVEIGAGRLPQAKNALEKALAATPDKPNASQALGVVALLSDDAAAAAAAFTDAARRAPKDDLPKIGLAVASALAKKTADADKALKALAERSGRVGHAARVDLAAIRIAAGPTQAAAAKEALGAAGGEDDRTPEASYVRGQIAEAGGALDEAQAAYGHAVTLAPNYFDALTALGRIAVQKGDHGSARAALERAIALQPGQLEPHALLAKALAGLGDEKGAATEDDQARRLEAQAKKEAKEQPGDEHKPAKVVGVTAFDNSGRDPKNQWLSVGIAEALSSDLPKLGGIRVVERAQLQKAFDEVRLQQLTSPDDKAAPEVGKIVGADALVVGSYQIVNGQIRVLGRLVAVVSGTVLRAGESSGRLDDLFNIERKLALDLLSDYAGASGPSKDAFFKSQAPALGSLEAVARAQVALSRGDTAEAKAQIAKASAADPTFAAGYADLKKSAEATANAAVLPFTNSSRRASDDWLAGGIAEALSGDLRKLGVPQVERLAIEKVMTEKRFTEMFSESGDTVKQAGKQIGAKALVVGSFQSDGTSIRMDARLVDVATNKVLLADHVDGKMADLFQLETQLAINLGKQLNPKVSESDAAELEDDHPSLAEYEKKMKGHAPKVAKMDPKTVNEAPQKVAQQLAATGVVWVPDSPSAVPPPVAPKNKQAVPAFVETRIVLTGDRVRIDGRIVDQRNNFIIASTTAEGPRDQAPGLEQQVAAELARAVAALPPAPSGGVR